MSTVKALREALFEGLDFHLGLPLPLRDCRLSAQGSMMKAMGTPEMVFILVLALVVFGPKRLPEIARQIGRMMNEFKRASNEFRAQIESEISQLDEDQKRQILPPAEPPRGAVPALSGVVLPPERPSFSEPGPAGKAPDA